MKLLSNKTWNYPFAVMIWIGLFLLLQFLLKKTDLTDQLWGLLALIGSGLLVGSSITNVPKRQTAQLIFMGTQTGVWIDEGYYFLFHLFTLDEHEKQEKEKQTLIVPAFDLRCVDKILSVSFNLKYLQGRSNLLNPSIEDERIAKENFKNQKVEDMENELVDMMKSLSMSQFGGKKYAELHGQNLSSFILTNGHFTNECTDYGIKITSLLPFVIPKNTTQEDLDLRKAELISQYQELGYSREEAREMAEIQLGQIKVVKTPGGGDNRGGVFGHYNV